MGHSSSRPSLVALALGLYAGVLTLASFYSLMVDSPFSRRLHGWLDLDDLIWTAPVAGLAAVILATVQLLRRRPGGPRYVAALLLGLPSLVGVGLILAALIGAGGLLDQL